MPKPAVLALGAVLPNPDCPNPDVEGVVVGTLLAAPSPNAAGCPENAENAPPAVLPLVVAALGLANAEKPPPVVDPNAPVPGFTSDDWPNEDCPNAAEDVVCPNGDAVEDEPKPDVGWADPAKAELVCCGG